MARHSVKQEADIRQCRPCDVERGISSNTWWLWYGLHPGMPNNPEYFTNYNLDTWIGNSIAWFASIPTKTSGKANY